MIKLSSTATSLFLLAGASAFRSGSLSTKTNQSTNCCSFMSTVGQSKAEIFPTNQVSDPRPPTMFDNNHFLSSATMDNASNDFKFQTYRRPRRPAVINQSVLKPSDTSSSWKSRLVETSNIFSIFCVLDCTLLPLLSLIIPALSWIATGTANSGSSPILTTLSTMIDQISSLGHVLALYLVIPLGAVTSLVNYAFGHREIRLTAMAWLALLLIYAANSTGLDILFGTAAAHACHAGVGACTEGWAHRGMNTMGCALLWGSNYLGQKYMRQGCAASTLAKAWGGSGDQSSRECDCDVPRVLEKNVVATGESEMFFSWEPSETDL